jgi:hypothetical protein
MFLISSLVTPPPTDFPFLSNMSLGAFLVLDVPMEYLRQSYKTISYYR